MRVRSIYNYGSDTVLGGGAARIGLGRFDAQDIGYFPINPQIKSRARVQGQHCIKCVYIKLNLLFDL